MTDTLSVQTRRLAELATREEEAEFSQAATTPTRERVARLEQQLAESEEDRAKRLENMHTLDGLLRESEARCAALQAIVDGHVEPRYLRQWLWLEHLGSRVLGLVRSLWRGRLRTGSRRE